MTFKDFGVGAVIGLVALLLLALIAWLFPSGLLLYSIVGLVAAYGIALAVVHRRTLLPRRAGR